MGIENAIEQLGGKVSDVIRTHIYVKDGSKLVKHMLSFFVK
jgi:enamine deaminase RidA (YjgF/YER057c/UK114 family)